MDKVEVKDTSTPPQILVATSPRQAHPSVWMHLRVLREWVLGRVFPQFPIPGYCLSCWARLEMVIDLPLDRSDMCLVQEVRLWRCPECGHGASTRHASLHDPSFWE